MGVANAREGQAILAWGSYSSDVVCPLLTVGRLAHGGCRCKIVVARLMKRIFRWDPAKAASNARKHRVGFDLAIRVFGDPFAYSAQDRVEAGEVRWQTIGLVEGILVLVVAHTVESDGDDEIIRIISARRADRSERRPHEELH